MNDSEQFKLVNSTDERVLSSIFRDSSLIYNTIDGKFCSFNLDTLEVKELLTHKRNIYSFKPLDDDSFLGLNNDFGIYRFRFDGNNLDFENVDPFSKIQSKFALLNDNGYFMHKDKESDLVSICRINSSDVEILYQDKLPSLYGGRLSDDNNDLALLCYGEIRFYRNFGAFFDFNSFYKTDDFVRCVEFLNPDYAISLEDKSFAEFRKYGSRFEFDMAHNFFASESNLHLKSIQKVSGSNDCIISLPRDYYLYGIREDNRIYYKKKLAHVERESTYSINDSGSLFCLNSLESDNGFQIFQF